MCLSRLGRATEVSKATSARRWTSCGGLVRSPGLPAPACVATAGINPLPYRSPIVCCLVSQLCPLPSVPPSTSTPQLHMASLPAGVVFVGLPGSPRWSLKMTHGCPGGNGSRGEVTGPCEPEDMTGEGRGRARTSFALPFPLLPPAGHIVRNVTHESVTVLLLVL